MLLHVGRPARPTLETLVRQLVVAVRAGYESRVPKLGLMRPEEFLRNRVPGALKIRRKMGGSDEEAEGAKEAGEGGDGAEADVADEPDTASDLSMENADG